MLDDQVAVGHVLVADGDRVWELGGCCRRRDRAGRFIGGFRRSDVFVALVVTAGRGGERETGDGEGERERAQTS